VTVKHGGSTTLGQLWSSSRPCHHCILGDLHYIRVLVCQSAGFVYDSSSTEEYHKVLDNNQVFQSMSPYIGMTRSVLRGVPRYTSGTGSFLAASFFPGDLCFLFVSSRIICCASCTNAPRPVERLLDFTSQASWTV
jgi:hypothetical protein